jgi:hypothetical protein
MVAILKSLLGNRLGLSDSDQLVVVDRYGVGRQVAYQEDLALVYAAEQGAPGGTADDTDALQAVIDQASTWTAIMLSSNTYNIEQLAWNKEGVVLVSPHPQPRSGATVKPQIKALTAASYLIKIGVKENYTTGMLRSMGLCGVQVNGNGLIFSDAMLVVEGLQNGQFHGTKLAYSGVATIGQGCRAMRGRVLWDTVFDRFNLLDCHNPNGSLIYFDDAYSDSSGNCNNLRFDHGHYEKNTGAYFASHTTGNLDILTILNSKFERGVNLTPAGASYLFDFAFANRLIIADNSLTNYTAANSYTGILKLDSGSINKMKDNDFGACSGVLVNNGSTAQMTEVYENRQYNSAAAFSFINSSTYPARIELPSSNVGSGTLGGGFAYRDIPQNNGLGWISAHDVTANNSATFIPDPACVNPPKSVMRRTDATAQATTLSIFPLRMLSDFPVDVTLYARVRRLSASTSTLQLNLAGNTIAGSTIAALPSTITTVSFTGNGTTCTATKTAHGLSTGDAISITATTSYNTTALIPVFITVVDANTFTFASTANTAGESGTVQKHPWQVISFAIVIANMVNAGNVSTHRFRVEYGASNAAPIDIDAYAFKY